MATKQGKYFPTQASGERVFLLIRRHWIIFFGMVAFIFALIIPIIVLIFYWFFAPETFSGPLGNFVIVFAGVYTLVVLALLLYGFVNYYLDVYIVTNERIVDIRQHGFFHREIAELHLRQVQDVEAEVGGFFQTLFHYGDIYIQTAGERENFIFHDVPNPYTLSKKIIELQKAQIDSERFFSEPKSAQKNNNVNIVDDYRPEDYLGPMSEPEQAREPLPHEKETAETVESHGAEDNLEESEGAIKYLKESYNPKTEKELEEKLQKEEKEIASNKQTPPEEVGFGSSERSASARKQFEKELKELSEGQEISLDNDEKD